MWFLYITARFLISRVFFRSMYEIKKELNDFIVKEISNWKFQEEGIYAIAILQKTNYTTIRAIEHIALALNIPLKFISFAGTKDKNAITTQYISIKGIKKERIEKIKLKDIELEFCGYLDKPISLGELEGNEFIITVKNITEDEIKKVEEKITQKVLMPNYFGEQRFSRNNIEIGKLLLQNKYKEAAELIISSNSDYKTEMEEELKKNNPVSAIRKIPKKLILIYIHAYQSKLWNKVMKEYTFEKKENAEIPVIGFGTEFENEKIEEIYEKIMKEEGITLRNFINRSIPELSTEGTTRIAFVEIEDLKIIEKQENSIKLNFKLKKGSYATIAIAYLFDCIDTVCKDFI